MKLFFRHGTYVLVPHDIYFVKFYEYLKKHKVELVSVQDGISSSNSNGRLMFGVLSSSAEHDKEQITFRLHSGRIMKTKLGIRGFGSQIPFGYKKSGSGDINVDKDGSKKVPVMLHRALFGSLERFIGILIENYSGKLPFWISPSQIMVIPVSEDFNDYSVEVNKKLIASG